MATLGPEKDFVEAEERMRSVVDHVLDGIITIDQQGIVATFNPAAERIFGYAASEVIGQNVRMLMPEPDRGQHDRYIGNYLRTGQAKIIGIGREVVGRRKDGSTFPMELAISEFRLRGQRYFTGIVRDITERKRLEDELRHRLAELAEGDRQKNEFLAMLGHELRNPLGPMRNALTIMRIAAGDAGEIRQAQDIIDRQLQHLTRLVDDLLDISRIIRGRVELRRERIDLADAVRRAVEIAQPAADASGHRLEVRHAARPVSVMGDLVRLSQVVSNLLTNAVKYSTRPGMIELTVRTEGGLAVIEVRDEGEGIPAHLLPRVFDLFVQGDSTLARSQGGLGIGLTLVRRLVEMHGGSVRAQSDGPGRGSRFTITLPAADGAGTQNADAAPARPAGEPRRVLVVDDNVDALQSLAKLLTLQGHQVAAAGDGEAALAAAQRFGPDVIVLDIGLPGMDGYTVARLLRKSERFRATPLIAVTGYGQEEDRRRSREAGFDQHLTKPVDPAELQQLITAAPRGLGAATLASSG